MEFVKRNINKHAQKIRFGIVGVANTALDFGILFLLVNTTGLGDIGSNFISTGIAFIFSFFVNRSFTFKSTGGNAKKQFLLFIIVTMIGLWIIQPLAITVTSAILSPFIDSSNLLLLVAKLAASVASLIWNYIFYSRLVFKKAPEQVL